MSHEPKIKFCTWSSVYVSQKVQLSLWKLVYCLWRRSLKSYWCHHLWEMWDPVASGAFWQRIHYVYTVYGGSKMKTNWETSTTALGRKYHIKPPCPAVRIFFCIFTLSDQTSLLSDTSRQIGALLTSAHQLTRAGLRRMTPPLTQIDVTKRHWGAKAHQFFKLEARSQWAHAALSLSLDAPLAAPSKRALWGTARRDWALSVHLKHPHSPQQMDRDRASPSPTRSPWKTTGSHFAWCAT